MLQLTLPTPSFFFSFPASFSISVANLTGQGFSYKYEEVVVSSTIFQVRVRGWVSVKSLPYWVL